jgi:SAM-dependent methyltransferase
MYSPTHTELISLDKNEVINAFLWLQGHILEMLIGDQVECPFCGVRLSRFLPHGEPAEASTKWRTIGTGSRSNGFCPSCFSIDRERLVYLYLLQKTTIFTRPSRVLHVAPELRLTRLLSQQTQINYTTTDLNPVGVMVQADITAMPFDDNLFDFVICNHVLEHVLDDRTAIAEIYRVLKQKGQAIVQVPLSPELSCTYEDPSIISREQRLEAFGQDDHVRIYAVDYLDRLRECGFEVHVYEPLTELRPELIARYGLIKEEKVFVCVK